MKQSVPWFSATEIARACACTPERVEALARAHHWPRVHGPAGAKYPMRPETVRRALVGNPWTVHGRHQ